MQALTKKPHTKNNSSKDMAVVAIDSSHLSGEVVEKNIIGPEELVDSEEYIDANDFIGEHSPGKALRAYRNREGFTQAQLAKQSGISLRNLSMMENNKRPIGKKTTKLLAGILNCSYKRFL